MATKATRTKWADWIKLALAVAGSGAIVAVVTYGADRQAFTDTTTRSKGNSQRIATLEATDSAHDARLNALDKQDDRILDAISQQTQTIDKHFEHLNQRIDELK